MRDDVVEIARDLIGKNLHSHMNGHYCCGTIVETEAYNGRNDKACHAYPQKKTERTKIMFEEGGLTYVYLCYGIHKMFNIVTNIKGMADAVLIRAVEPQIGQEIMEERRKISASQYALTSGPGNVCKAFGIDLDHYGTNLQGDQIWITNNEDSSFDIEERKRIGVDYAADDKDLLWRFIMKNNKWVSKRNFG